jgi:hypothetical protein
MTCPELSFCTAQTCTHILKESYMPTKDRMAFATGGIEVKSTVMVPKRLIDRLLRAAALGSVLRRSAVAMALELMPSVTPLVT